MTPPFFLAMTQFQLNQKPEAATTLARPGDTMKTWPKDFHAEDLLKEAEKVVEPEN